MERSPDSRRTLHLRAQQRLPSVQALGTGETLTDTFTYQAIDNHGAIGSNTLTVTINGTNDARR